jgi:hypothetical protein
LEREEQEKEQEEQSYLELGIPVCGANLSTPVVDQANFNGKMTYRLYRL